MKNAQVIIQVFIWPTFLKLPHTLRPQWRTIEDWWSRLFSLTLCIFCLSAPKETRILQFHLSLAIPAWVGAVSIRSLKRKHAHRAMH